MTERFCKKCNHLCHCMEADHSDCKCENCECNGREEDSTYENNGGLVIDDTGECESCQQWVGIMNYYFTGILIILLILLALFGGPNL